ncbi:GvpL/GvpF family gas vesicle protein [Streptomyces sp. NPDC051219]|uniref:GvpL/GvpF family gas vesicle protein n=1 Tax=Streptomyces sp. NPDC051219 TaxID=3155283 RepID=UPI00341E466D
MTAAVSYLYGVVAVHTGLYDMVAVLRGIADAPVRLVPDEDENLAAIVSSVPAGDFEEAPLAAHLEDLDWLEAVARAHHRVIDAMAAQTTVLPLRLATIYRDDDRVRAMVRAARRAFAHRLAHLAGRVEWGVKIYFDPPAAPAASTAAAPAADLSPGRAYLRSRHQERHARQDAYRAAEQAAQRVEAAACALAVEHARHRLQQGPLAHGSGENIVNNAYLVPDDQAQDFKDAVQRAAEQSEIIRVEITGPWAPYSFAASGQDEPGEKSEEAIT